MLKSERQVDAVKRKVISELFFAPSVVLPIVGGLSAGLLSWAAGGNQMLTIGALGGVLGGMGWMLTRLIFRVEEITEQVMQVEAEQRAKAEAEELDKLAEDLCGDGDHRTQDYLTLLRSLRDDIEHASNRPGIQFRSAEIRRKVGLLFEAAVEQLRHSLRLWELSESLKGEARRKVLANREKMLVEIGITVERLQQMVQQFQELMRDDSQVDLAAMREELDRTMEAARRTEKRMREMERVENEPDSMTRE